MSTFQPIKILKRQPNSDPCLTGAPARAAPSRQIKTLEEREAAYAEARLRILGPSAHNGCETNTNGHANHNPRSTGAAKYPAEPNIKIISNAIRQNADSKT